MIIRHATAYVAGVPRAPTGPLALEGVWSELAQKIGDVLGLVSEKVRVHPILDPSLDGIGYITVKIEVVADTNMVPFSSKLSREVGVFLTDRLRNDKVRCDVVVVDQGKVTTWESSAGGRLEDLSERIRYRRRAD